MSAGQMRDHLELLTPVTADDGRGGQQTIWPTFGPALRGFVRAATAREQMTSAGAVQTVATHIVLVNFDARITTAQRLKRVGHAAPTLEILGPPRDIDGRRRYLELSCAEVI